MVLPSQLSILSAVVMLSARGPAQRVIAVAISSNATDRRSALPRQPSQVSEGNRTRQSGTWEAAATAGIRSRHVALLLRIVSCRKLDRGQLPHSVHLKNSRRS